MGDLELESGPRGGGRARDSGTYYHASFRSGSRAGGACARAAHDYIAREGDFAGPDHDPAIYTESGHMPAWADEDAQEYWDGADLYERANGRLYVAGNFALPRGLELQDQVEVARAFVESLTDLERLPYTWAIHAGADRDGQEHNPHVHVMISERQNDGLERSRENWFKRANRTHPERGGARKSRAFHGRGWVERARENLAGAINEKLRQLDRDERVDHRSYARQGIDREPGHHFGPKASHMVERGYSHDRLEDAAGARDGPDVLADVDRQIDRLERLRDAIERGDGTPHVDSPSRAPTPSVDDYTRDDESRER